ncbi:T9SS type A sorting domain-containing protein [candidate division GN15 bacterium]|nr:T9SS type A sorting domain-containing protein [candidate division GN15 bacterium]
MTRSVVVLSLMLVLCVAVSVLAGPGTPINTVDVGGVKMLPLSVGNEATVDTVINLFQWPSSAGGNDHWYGVIPLQLSWNEADSLTRSLVFEGWPGYLATAVSLNENNFILDVVLAGTNQPSVEDEFALGGVLTQHGWVWITEEVFAFQHWALLEPNNLPDEDAVMMWGPNTGSPLKEPGFWNNSPRTTEFNPDHRFWAVVEFGGYDIIPPTPDYDTPEPPPPPPVFDDSLVHMVQWPVEAGGNGHWYAVLAVLLPWEEAAVAAGSLLYENRPGFLATVRSQAENDFILNEVIVNLSPPSIMDQYLLGGLLVNDVWQWAEGDSITWFNWSYGEPNHLPIENALAMWGPTNIDPNRVPGRWNNIPSDTSHNEDHVYWSIIEWGDNDLLTNAWSLNPVQWPASQGGNNHYYAVLPRALTIELARTEASHYIIDRLAGYLACPETEEENAFITDHVLADLNQPGPMDMYHLGGVYTLNQWYWAQPDGGTPIDWFNWADGEPEADLALYWITAMYGPTYQSVETPSGSWNAVPTASGDPDYPGPLWSLLEWDVETQAIDTPAYRIRWQTAEGGNGHWYALLDREVTRSEADSIAATMEIGGQPGYVATITSADEQAFLREALLLAHPPDSGWSAWHLGARYADGFWDWSTGEAMSYSHWAPDEPDDLIGGSSIAARSHVAGGDPDSAGIWLVVSDSHEGWAIIEFGPPESPPPVPDTLTNLVQWRVEDGGNDHYYAVLTSPLNWLRADSLARTLMYNGRPGYLATVTSAWENEFIRSQVIAGAGQPNFLDRYHLGAMFWGLDWEWVTEERLTFTRWAPQQPVLSPQCVTTMWGDGNDGMSAIPGTWVSAEPTGAGFDRQFWSVVEFSYAPGGWTAYTDTLLNLVQWPVEEGGNDNWYAVIPHRVEHQTAEALLASLEVDGYPGRLASITSQEENDFIVSMVTGGLNLPGYPDQYWLAGEYRSTDGWSWQPNAFPFVFVNWGPGFPVDPTIAPVAAMFGTDRPIDIYPEGMWHNIPDAEQSTAGVLVEFGPVDSIPVPPPQPDSIYRLTQWRIEDGGNDHWYAMYTVPLQWLDARDVAPNLLHDGQAGYLATVTSEAEDLFIYQQIVAGVDAGTDGNQFYLGGFDESGWQWLTGEPWSYTNWSTGEPNNPGNERGLAMWGDFQTNPARIPGAWNNTPFDTSFHPRHLYFSIVEWDPADSAALRAGEGLPDRFEVAQNYPNPFNPSTTIEFALPGPSVVILEVFNVMGQRVAVLADRVHPAGHHAVVWDGTDYAGSRVSSGIYFYRLRSSFGVATHKMLLVK